MDWLTHADFAGLVGDSFLVGLPGSDRLTLVLEEVAVAPDLGGVGPDGLGRRQFTLLFRGPEGLVQGTWQVHHAAIGDRSIFLVPVEHDRYEAVFA